MPRRGSVNMTRCHNQGKKSGHHMPVRHSGWSTRWSGRGASLISGLRAARTFATHSATLVALRRISNNLFSANFIPTLNLPISVPAPLESGPRSWRQ